MGVKQFFSWLKSKFEGCIQKPQNAPRADNLLIDLNGLFHQCAQKVYNYGLKKRLLDDTPQVFVNKDKEVFIEVCQEIDRLLFLVNPTKRLVLCVDGVAPISKQCLVKGTLVSMKNGTSKSIENILENEDVLGWTGSGFTYTRNTGLQEKGKKKTVKITLFDGRTLTLTPDHKMLIKNGEKYEWKKAGLIKKDDRLVMGLEMPEDRIDEFEDGWKLDLDGVVYTMNNTTEREKSLTLARILGLISSDGYILENKSRSGVYIGTSIDALMFVDDIEILTGFRPSVYYKHGDKGSVFEIKLPNILTKQLIQMEGITRGKKVTKPVTLPSFLLSDDCPKSILREFLGGLFGGDGHSPVVSNDTICSVKFSQSTIEKFDLEFQEYFKNIGNILSRLGVDNYIRGPYNHTYKNDKMKPKDVDENPRLKYEIVVPSLLEFGTKIGFKYATNKNLRLSVSMAYDRYAKNVDNQRRWITSRAIELFEAPVEYKCPYCFREFAQRTGLVRHQKYRCKVKKTDNIPRSSLRFETALEQARKEFTDPILHSKSLSSVDEVRQIHTSGYPISDRRIRYITGVKEFLNLTETTDWFIGKDKQVTYAMEQCSGEIPHFLLPVLDIREGDEEYVYDIEVVENHSFLANGICVHNCQQRQRRFAAAASRDPEIQGFDSCCISPGTDFMHNISRFIVKYIHIKKETQPELEIVFSDHSVPGEGEHKLLKYIRESTENEVFYVYSPDADLVMLCIATMKLNLFVAREIDGMTKCNLYLISIDKFRQSLVNTYGWPGCSPENMGLDFILLFFFVGNDFLPNIPTMSIIDNGIERALDAYRSQQNLGYLTKLSKGELKINGPALKHLLSQLGSQEEDMINSKLNSKRAFYEDLILQKNTIQSETGSKIKFDTYRKDYYAKLFRKSPTKADVKKVCKEYLQGAFWVLNYYVKGVQDWNWRYPYLYAPFMTDLAENMGRFKSMELNDPVDAYLQLMCILPKSSFNLLPTPLNEAFNDPEICGLFPEKIEIDLSGKHNPWEGVVIVPFVDMEKTKGVYEKLAPLMEKRYIKRMKFGEPLVFK